MNIAIISGELSGDIIGGALAKELRALLPNVRLWGLGSAAMAEAGVELLADSSSWGAISISEALRKVPGLLWNVKPRVEKALRENRPDVVVLIDFGAFNVRAARYCKSLGLKVLYYFPPGSWRRYGKKGAELARITDRIAAPFPWTADRLRAFGANVEYVGHPITERVRAEMSREQFAGHFGMDPARPIIGILPGSRHHEVEHLMPTLLDAARLIYSQEPGAQFVVGVAPSIEPEEMARYLSGHEDVRNVLTDIWHDFRSESGADVWPHRALSPRAQRAMVTPVGVVVVPVDVLDEEAKQKRREEERARRLRALIPPTVIAKGLTYEVMAHSDVLLICSGTATLEACMFATPMVIVYRGSKIMEIEYRLRGLKKAIPFIGLPNILANRSVVPELLQNDASPEAITEVAMPMLNDPAVRARIRADLAEVRALLGEPGASAKTARMVVELLQEKTRQ